MKRVWKYLCAFVIITSMMTWWVVLNSLGLQWRSWKVEHSKVVLEIANDTKKELIVHKKVSLNEDMDVYLRMSTVNTLFPKLYDSVFVQSIRYFWPELKSLLVVLDDDRKEDHTFAETIQKTFPYPRVCFMAPIIDVKFSGYDRMQRDMFYPDKCSSKKYVGYVDTDTIFIARVIPEALFEEGKPIIIGVYGNYADLTWDRAAKTTATIFKTREVMKCMTYFPVIMKVEHMVGLRKYLEKLHKLSLDSILQTKKTVMISQFNIMCQYVWLFHRHEYRFYLQYKFGAKQVSTGREDPAYYNRTLLPENTVPFPRVCDHYKYHEIYGSWKRQTTYRTLFKASICFSGGFEICPETCNQFKKDSLRREMFRFDFNDWTWDDRCLAAQLKYYKDASKYDSPEYSETIRKACNEVDNITWHAQ